MPKKDKKDKKNRNRGKIGTNEAKQNIVPILPLEK